MCKCYCSNTFFRRKGAKNFVFVERVFVNLCYKCLPKKERGGGWISLFSFFSQRGRFTLPNLTATHISVVCQKCQVLEIKITLHNIHRMLQHVNKRWGLYNQSIGATSKRNSYAFLSEVAAQHACVVI